VVVKVTDNGPGIPEAAVAHIFDRFYRVDPSRSRRSGGSGLGLSIVEAIMTAHGGTASASNVEGRGARITITLPGVVQGAV
jgi:two-component system OmpR family sensor kinase